LGHLDLQDQ
jgi:hypothetical protein